MVKFVNSWMKGIILAVIVTIIIEMLIPEGKNKKYIKMVIGLYIIYTIISPFITKTINLENVFTTYETPKINIEKIDNNKVIKETYEENIKKDIKENLINLGYSVIEIDVIMNTKDEGYGEIEKIKLSVKKEKNKAVKTVEKIEINKREKEQKEELSEVDRKTIAHYLITNYGVSETNIIVNNE